MKKCNSFVFIENATHRKTFSVSILFINQSYGVWLGDKQGRNGILPNRWDFSFLEYIRKAVQCSTDHEEKLLYWHVLQFQEALQDYWTESIKELKPLIQFDPEPNLELKEAKVELYKISISFSSGGMI